MESELCPCVAWRTRQGFLTGNKKEVMQCEQNHAACIGRRYKRRLAPRARYTAIRERIGARHTGKLKRPILEGEMMRKIYQMDCKGGLLSIGEREQPDQVALCLHTGKKELQVLLSRDQFRELCKLEYTVQFAPLDLKQTTLQLRSVDNG